MYPSLSLLCKLLFKGPYTISDKNSNGTGLNSKTQLLLLCCTRVDITTLTYGSLDDSGLAQYEDLNMGLESWKETSRPHVPKSSLKMTVNKGHFHLTISPITISCYAGGLADSQPSLDCSPYIWRSAAYRTFIAHL